MTVFLQSLATALPPNQLPQDIVAEKARDLLGSRFAGFDRFLSSFTRAGIEKRYSVVPIDWFESPHGWADRNAAYISGASELFMSAAGSALDRAGWEAAEVDCIVTVSTTGVATPSLEARVASRMGFRDDVRRVPVFGLGCAGGVSGLSVAESLAAARPGDKVLLVAVEVCTVSFKSNRPGPQDIIATVLFGDGAAAACLSTDPDPVRLAPGYQITWPDTLDIMGWAVDDDGLGVSLDRGLPALMHKELATAVARACAACGVRREALERFVFHPGGMRIVEAIEAALDLGQGALDVERDVLRLNGNMSAPTVLFVLERVLAEGRRGRFLAGAFGPGFTASFLPIEAEAA